MSGFGPENGGSTPPAAIMNYNSIKKTGYSSVVEYLVWNQMAAVQFRLP